jgi:hypothetical protein
MEKKYEKLQEHQRKSLPATNFWLIANGKEPIQVPQSDTHFYQYFTPETEAQAIRYF